MYSGSACCTCSRSSCASDARHALRHRVVRHQALVPGPVLPRHHHRLAHASVLRKPRLDLAQARSGSRGSSPGDRCAPETRWCRRPGTAPGLRSCTDVSRRHERIGDEPLRRQLRLVQIAARKPDTANVKLPRHPDRHRMTMPVQNVNLRVRDRAADGNELMAALAEIPGCSRPLLRSVRTR